MCLLVFSFFIPFQSGIDLAVDKEGRIWIIEVNVHNPSHGLFNKLKNKQYYVDKDYRYAWPPF
ncbi:hypothetical protein ASD40_25500 [Paenibacillus sp. Root444D2]|nr:hypothetical protein ASD40_25500 [Paenibacillus sp. Root444D2]